MNAENREMVETVFPKINKVVDSAVRMAFDHHPELPQHLRRSVAKRVRGQVVGYIATTIHHKTRR